MEKWFLTQIQHNNDAWQKGCVVHDTKEDALNGFHAYFGAYGYGKIATIDYVACYIADINGAVIRSEVDDRLPDEEESEE